MIDILPSFVTPFITIEDATATIAKPSDLAMKKCCCYDVIIGVSDNCVIDNKKMVHDCICIMGPECVEECLALLHICSCAEVVPDTCRMKDDEGVHECSCRIWSEDSCRCSSNHS